MRIRFIKNPMNIDAKVGEELNLPDQLAKDFIRDGYAVLAIVRGFSIEDTGGKQRSEKGVMR